MNELTSISPHETPAISEPIIGSTAPDAIYLGRIIEPKTGVGCRIHYGGEQGIVVIGPNGKGKGTGILMPNFLQLEQISAVAVDPKGQLAAVTAPYRATLGKVVMINPRGVHTDLPGYEYMKSDGFNPFGDLDHKSPKFNGVVARRAAALVPIDGGSDNPFFSKAGRNFVALCIMWATITAREAGRVPTMGDVLDLVNIPSDEPNKGNDYKGEGLPVLARQIITYEATMSPRIPGLRYKAAQFKTWNKTTQSIVLTAQTELDCFADTEIADDMAKGTFDFADMKREPVTVYLVLPPDDLERQGLAKWLRLVLTVAIQSVMRIRMPGEPKVLFALDEFYALGHLEIVSTVWALVRGYGVQIMPILQNLGQLQELYGKNWETFVGMAGATVSFATNDATTAKWLSDRGGDTARSVVSRNVTTSENWGESIPALFGGGSSMVSKGGGLTTSDSSSPMKTTMITPHTLYGLPFGYMVGAFDGLKNLVPIYAGPYYNVEKYNNRKRKDPYHLDGA